MVLMEERQRREREIELQSKFMQEQMEMLIKMVADQLSIKLPERGAEMVEQDMEFTKLTETDICRGQERNVPPTGGEESSPKEQYGCCKKLGHTLINRKQEQKISIPITPGKVCFNFGEEGHIKVNCTKEVLYCNNSTQSRDHEAIKARIYCRGLVEEKQVNNIVLDTGCSKMRVQQELVSPNKISEVQLGADGTQLQVEAAVSEKLPVAAIIEEDMPQLMNLLESREEENEAGSIPTEGNLGAQKNPQDQEKIIDDSSQVNQETICDSLAMFRVHTEPMNEKTFEAEEEALDEKESTNGKQKLIDTEHNRDQQGRKKYEAEEEIDQASTYTQTALFEFG